VNTKGQFISTVPYVAGMHVLRSDGIILDIAKERSTLLFEERIVHSYPHSWRSKKPLITLLSPQWYISLQHNQLRSTTIQQLDRIQWFPEESKNRMLSMISSRPDRCITRQRAGRVPLSFFINKK